MSMGHVRVPCPPPSVRSEVLALREQKEARQEAQIEIESLKEDAADKTCCVPSLTGVCCYVFVNGCTCWMFLVLSGFGHTPRHSIWKWSYTMLYNILNLVFGQWSSRRPCATQGLGTSRDIQKGKGPSVHSATLSALPMDLGYTIRKQKARSNVWILCRHHRFPRTLQNYNRFYSPLAGKGCPLTTPWGSW